MKSKVSPEEPTGEVMIRGRRGLVKIGILLFEWIEFTLPSHGFSNALGTNG